MLCATPGTNFSESFSGLDTRSLAQKNRTNKVLKKNQKTTKHEVFQFFTQEPNYKVVKPNELESISSDELWTKSYNKRRNHIVPI